MDNYVDNVRPYNISSHDIWKIDKSKKKNCLKLDWNEATISPSPNVRRKLKELADKADFYQWYPNTHNSELINLISKYMDIGKENIQVFASSDTLQEYIVRCWLKYGDKVLILWPTYDNLRATVESAGAEIIYSVMDNLRFNRTQLQKDIELCNPKMVYICNPNNPTGEQIGIDVLEDIVRIYKDTLFLVDEAYVEFSGETSVGLTKIYDNLLVSRTFSKAFALANFRIGYLISSKKNIAVISKVRNSKNITTFSQEAAIAALEDLEYMYDYVKEVEQAREFFINEMNSMSWISAFPSKANFVLIRLSDREMKQEFFHYMKKRNIYIRDLRQDILSEYFARITIGTREQMEIVVENIKQFEVLHHENSGI